MNYIKKAKEIIAEMINNHYEESSKAGRQAMRLAWVGLNDRRLSRQERIYSAIYWLGEYQDNIIYGLEKGGWETNIAIWSLPIRKIIEELTIAAKFLQEVKYTLNFYGDATIIGDHIQWPSIVTAAIDAAETKVWHGRTYPYNPHLISSKWRRRWWRR